MQQHGVKPMGAKIFLSFYFRILPQLHDQNSNAICSQGKCFPPECDSLLREVIINAFLNFTLIIKHCTKDRRGGEGFLCTTEGASSIRQRESRRQCNKPPSPLLPTIGLRLNQAAGFNWKIREIISFNDRSRRTVLDWIVNEAQHFFLTSKKKKKKGPDNQIQLLTFSPFKNWFEGLFFCVRICCVHSVWALHKHTKPPFSAR